MSLFFSHMLFSFSRSFIGAVLVYSLIKKGIDISIISFSKSIQLFISVISTVYLGKIANKFGNKISLIMACFFEIIYFILMISPYNISVLIGEGFNGLAIASYSGAYEATLLNLKNKKSENNFALLSISKEIMFIGMLLSGVIGAFLSEIVFYISIIFMIIAAVSFYLVDYNNNYYIYKNQIKLSIINSFKFFIKKTDSNVLFFCLLGGTLQLYYQLWPVFFKEQLNLSQKNIGIIFGISMTFQFILTFLVRKFNFYSKMIFENLFLYLIILTYFIFLFFFLKKETIPIIILYCLSQSFLSIIINFYHTKSCNIYYKLKNNSEMISWLDCFSRLSGALLLIIPYKINFLANNTQIIWSIPIIIIVFIIIQKNYNNTIKLNHYF